MTDNLSKSDFHVAQTCPAKLYYRKRRYPSTQDEDETLEFLADGGYLVEAIARLLHPEGVEVEEGRSPEDDARQTLAALRAERITLFGATLLHSNLLARADILKKDGSHFELIEVKSKSYDSADPEGRFVGKRGGIASEWREYLEDVAFQVHILRQLFPQAEITPCLCLPDKAKTTSIDRLFAQFTLTPPGASTHFHRPVVSFTGDAEKLRRDHCLATVNVKAEVDMLLPEVSAKAAQYAASLFPLTRLPALIGADCRDCEYRVEPEVERNGFRECWGALADVTPHLLDMYQVGKISGHRANELIAQDKAGLYDLTEADLQTKKGEVGPIDQRRRIQLKHTRENTEWFSRELTGLLRGHRYPLHFIDFETSQPVVPYHAGMHPYELVAFQWSCHSIRRPGTPIQVEHAEWINVEDEFPNFAFAHTLRDWLGEAGTVFTWSHHERSVLSEIRRQMDARPHDDPALRAWLDDLLTGDRLVDLCAVARDHYFHPEMKGWVSLKAVLPAVWPAAAGLHSHPAFAGYYQVQDGRVLDPYVTLPPLPFGEGGDTAQVVREGTGAMRAYQEMLYGPSRADAAQRANWRRLLLQYCELDTAAMVIVWWHWANHCGVLNTT
jgi:hypothetical protein